MLNWIVWNGTNYLYKKLTWYWITYRGWYATNPNNQQTLSSWKKKVRLNDNHSSLQFVFIHFCWPKLIIGFSMASLCKWGKETEGKSKWKLFVLSNKGKILFVFTVKVLSSLYCFSASERTYLDFCFCFLKKGILTSLIVRNTVYVCMCHTQWYLYILRVCISIYKYAVLWDNNSVLNWDFHCILFMLNMEEHWMIGIDKGGDYIEKIFIM